MLRLDTPTSVHSLWSDHYTMNEIPEDVPPDNQLGLDEYARSFEDPCLKILCFNSSLGWYKFFKSLGISCTY